MTLKVSFITAVYNGSLFLPDLFLCIQRLKYRHFEFIILDDCSTDNSYQLISEFAKTCSLVKFERNPHNLGLSASRNRGLEIADGDIVSFVDCDDLFNAHYLDFIKNITNNLEKVFISSTIVFNPNKEYYPVSQFNPRRKNGKLLDTFPVAWGKFYPAYLVKKHNLRFCDGAVFEDEDFFFRFCLLNNDIEYQYVKNSIYFYRVGHSSIMSNASKKRFDFLKIIENMINAISPSSPEKFHNYMFYKIQQWIHYLPDIADTQKKAYFDQFKRQTNKLIDLASSDIHLNNTVKALSQMEFREFSEFLAHQPVILADLPTKDFTCKFQFVKLRIYGKLLTLKHKLL